MATVPTTHSKSSSKRISGQFVLFSWVFILSVTALILTSPSITLQNDAIVYLGLWFLFVAGFFFFVSKGSFSAKLNRPFDILEIPIYLSATSIFLIQPFGLAPYFDSHYLWVIPSVSYLPSGLLLTGTGLLSMWLGYVLVTKSFKRESAKQLNTIYRTPSPSLTLLIYVVVLILRLGLVSLGGGEMILSNKVRVGGNWYQWFVYLIELRWFFLALITLQVSAGRWPRRFLVFVLVFEGGMAIISGWSSLLPKMVLLVFACAIYARQHLPWRVLLSTAVVAIAAIIFSIPVVRDLRGARRSAEQVTWSDISSSIETTWGVGFENGFAIFSDLMVERQGTIAQTPSIIMEFFPKVFLFLPWQDLAVAPLTFIPRVIWPSKPAYSDIGGMLVTQVFGGQTGSAAPTIAGNAYMYGGWLVVVAGMFVLGVIAAFFYRWLAIPGLLNDQVGLLAVYAGIVIGTFHLGEGGFISLWQGLMQRTVVFLVVATILCMDNRKLKPDRNWMMRKRTISSAIQDLERTRCRSG